MLKAYLRRYDGVTQPVTVQHQGQHLGVNEGRVRFARLYWERRDPATDSEEAGYAALEEVVPLLDTLIVTRVSSVNGERAVFHGIVTEASSGNEMISVIAVDNPAQERLYDQPWWENAPLYPSDQAAPEQQAGGFAATAAGAPGQTPAQGVQTLGGAPLPQQAQVLPVGQGALLRTASTPGSSDPAARPGGHPAAHPAGLWQPLAQTAAAQQA